MSISAQKPVIIIAGPTASGKTSLAVKLAQELDAEIISSDSRQVYRYMDIGTAKPTLAERANITHHGFDIVDPGEPYSAGMFAKDARKWVDQIHASGKRAIVVGGSGLYLKALTDGFFAVDDIKDLEIRQQLEERAQKDGLEPLYNELAKLDPASHARMKPNDRQRILRALEVYHASGKPLSSLYESGNDEAPFTTQWFAIKHDRETLYDRINQRVDLMMDHGLMEEVVSLLDRGYEKTNALKSVGYAELIAHRNGEYESLQMAIEMIKQNTRNFAKRQLTWFRPNDSIQWMSPENALNDAIATIRK